MLQPESLIADIGSFQGDNGVYFANQGHKIVSVDIEYEPLAAGKQRAMELGTIAMRSYFINGDAQHLMFPNDKFDAVICMHMLQTIPEGYQEALSEVTRITKPGGLNAVKVYAADPEVAATRPKYKIFESGELANFYQKIGWQTLNYKEDLSNKAGEEGISSYSQIIAQKPMAGLGVRNTYKRQAAYYYHSDSELYYHYMELSEDYAPREGVS